MRRSLDIVTNTFHTDLLEASRAGDEACARSAAFERHLAIMPENEQRAQRSSLNVVTGECVDEALAERMIDEFPRSNVARGIIGLNRMAEIVRKRESESERNLGRVPCRYNNGRERELRDWNIVNAEESEARLAPAVRRRPTPWECCCTERLSE
jgi:hypothetical protein